MKAIVILPGAARALRRHRAYASDPATLANNVKRLSNTSALRLRVGDYRVIFEETDTEIVVTIIAPRGSAYD